MRPGITSRKGRIRVILALVAALFSGGGMIAHAQEATYLGRVQIVGGVGAACPAVFVSFNLPLSLLSKSTSDDGKTMTLRLRDTLAAPGQKDRENPIETYPQLTLPGLGALVITLDKSSATPIMTLRFPQAVAADVVQSGENSLVISGLAPDGAAHCGVNEEAQKTSPSQDVPQNADLVPPTDDTTEADAIGLPTDAKPVEAENQIETAYAQARAAITAKNYRRAAALLTNLVALPVHDRSADALELLGLVRERNGQIAHAKAEYQAYLEQYPNTEGAARVQQRLAVILTAEATPREKLRLADGGYSGPLDAPRDVRQILSIPRRGDTFKPLQDDGFGPEKARPTFSASFSTYYYRSQGSTLLTEFISRTTTTDTKIYQNSIVTSLDMSDSRETETIRLAWRVVPEYDHDIADLTKSTFSFSRAYGEITLKNINTTLRFGRQTRNNGGVFGRFDGGLVTWSGESGLTASVVFGQPVNSSTDRLFSSGRQLAGVSFGVVDIRPGLDIYAYAIKQTAGGFVDRQAVGLEGQYLSDNASVFALLDYDTYFGMVNTARLSGTRIFADRSSLTLTADYTHSPLLALSNALQGQIVTTLSALNGTYSLAQMHQLAIDRSTATSSLTAAYSKPLNDVWQFSVDGATYSTTGSPASGGVAAIAATGLEYYASVQFVGAGVFKEGDVVSLAARVASTSTSQLVLLDGYRRFQFSPKLRVQPRLRIGHRKVRVSGDTEWFAIPSITALYRVNSDVDFEVEIGSRLSSLKTPVFTSESNEFFAVIGFRREY